MARIVITTFGSTGDVNPFIALGIGLRARGHDVVFAVEDNARANVAAAGFPIYPLSGDALGMIHARVGDEVDQRAPLQWVRSAVREYLLPTLRPRIRELLAACDGADLLIAGFTQVAAVFVADLLAVPLVLVVLSPSVLPSATIAPVPLPFRLPRHAQWAYQRVAWVMSLWLLGRIFDRPVNRIRQDYGLRPYKRWLAMKADSTAAQLVAVAVSPALCPPASDWPDIVRETGFLFWDRPTTWRMPEVLAAFFTAPGPIVAVSCGSISLDRASDFATFYRHSIAAGQAVGVRTLVIGAPPAVLPNPLPPEVCVLPFAPFSEIYPRCAAVVHHGGIGTAAQALRAGVPQLIVPWGLDQFWTAEQVQRIGAGRVLPHRRYTAARAATMLRELLQSQDYRQRCAAIALKLGAEDGVGTLCDMIQDTLVTAAQQTRETGA
jgi:UDP:flavonoid glycosyltransferase YjiC (YdhE family)